LTPQMFGQQKDVTAQGFRLYADSVFEKNLQVDFLDAFDVGSYLDRATSYFESFRPAAIFNFGGTYSSKIFSKLMYKVAPVIYMQNNCSAHPTTLYYDIVLANGKDQDFYRYSQPKKWRPHTRYWEYFENSGKPLDFDFRFETELTMVTSARGFDYCVSLWEDEIFEKVGEVIDAHEVTWIFLGCKDSTKLLKTLKLKELFEQGRIVIVPWISNVRELFTQCDIFVHLPKDTGSGTTTLMAVAEQLAVFSLSGTDPCNFLAEDSIFETMDAEFAALHRALRDSSYRKQIALSSWERLQAFDRSVPTSEVLSAIAEGLENFQKRVPLSTDWRMFIESM
ncbi:MAG: hypothetical protein KDD62_05520, partial [Bdellovibrionales bacterium]|nr:hypothetical protein [Bdellovibrionales bacterium]